jgi:xanthine dehydrogenase large subunit
VNTKIRQLVADQFAIPVEHVLVMITSTEKNNNTSATAASSASDLNGSAAVNACLILKERLAQAASVLITTGRDDIQPSADNIIFENGQVYDARRPDRKVSFKELVKYAHRQRVNLGERGFYATKGLDWNPETYQGNPFLYYTMGAAVSEVLIDRFTGDLQLLRCDLLMDIGRSINPGIDRGQIVGAFIQGYGWVTNEELRYTDKGMLLTHSPTTYKIPNIGDLPKIFNVACIDNPDNTSNVAGSKAVGEPPLLLGLSVWNAVKNALSYVNKEVKPVYLEIPATGEQILERISQLETPSKTASKSLQAATKKR